MTSEIKRKYGKILNTGLNSTSTEKVLAFVRDSVSRGYKFWISTPNPEIILAAQKDPELHKALENSDLAIPDGVGLLFAARFLGMGEIKIIKGREMFMDLIQLASKRGWKVFLLGGAPGVAKTAGLNLRKTFKGVRMAYFSGPKLNSRAEPVGEADFKAEKETIAQINEFKPQILFVAFGAPKQEKWIYKHIEELKIGGAMVIGGTIDYLAGIAPLPPKWAEGSLEWFWRLITQPRRIGRVLRATILFPWKVFLSRLKAA
jgi:N-acetylglucosaminyldiphosphoundecaprenol N-acetyl-beta-D-mannosaminyltransferase